jgi:inner membrane protein involved in colicin E2 resistance
MTKPTKLAEERGMVLKNIGTVLFIFYLILLSLADHFSLSHKFTKFSRVKNQPD